MACVFSLMATPALTLPSVQIDAAIGLLRAVPEICAAYLHGSAVKGGLRPDSDVDIAVLLFPGRSLEPAMRLELASELEAVLGRTVDLGLLSSANVVYAREVFGHGRLLFTRSEFHSARFQAQTLSMYVDLQLSRREVLEAYAA